MFVSIKGGSYARFQRALESGDLAAVRMAPLELPYVNLTDALEVCLLMRRQEISASSGQRFGGLLD